MTKRENSYIPEFSGNAQDLDQFVDMILTDMSLQQLAYYSLNRFAAEGTVTPSGYILPPSAAGDKDGCAGVDTDMPMPIHVGQTWDKKLARQVGEVIGEENRGQFELNNPNTKMYAALADMRINPLCGRYYEGYSEDTYLTGEMVSYTCSGFSGDDDFYLKTHINTKHYSTYNSEFDRLTKSNYISKRMLYEYQIPAFEKAIAADHAQGAMTSFGGTNEIPNVTAPWIRELQERYPYSLFCSSDLNADGNLLTQLGNSYDETYASTPQEVAALLIRTKAYSSNNELGEVPEILTVEDIAQAVENQVLGVIRSDLEEQIRPQIETWVRNGYFNQEDYPYKELTKDHTPLTSASEKSRETALQAAQDGFVLLKNENQTLPLSQDDKILAAGTMADIRVQPWYCIPTPDLANAELTPVQGMQAYLGDKSGNIAYQKELNGRNIRIKSVLNGKYLVLNDQGQITAEGENASDAAVFILYDWGQNAYGLREVTTGKFLSMDTESVVQLLEYGPYIDSDTYVPPVTYEENEDGQVTFRVGAIPYVPLYVVTSGTEFYQYYSKKGCHLAVDSESMQIIKGPATGEEYSSESLFEVEEIVEAGGGASSYAEEKDYAIVYLGADSFINSCEITDRTTLQVGAGQLELVENVANAFPGKTIVVVRHDFPLGIAAIQENPNVGAIIFAPYAGQYDSLALARTIFGESTPSGRLTGTWLKDISTLPPLKNRDGVDARYTVDMKNADPQELGLTYRYNDPEDTIYEFGYGLSYTDFSYTISGLQQQDDGVSVMVEVENTGSYPGKEVVPLFAAAQSSVYGSYIPKRQLVGFEKTGLLQPGEKEKLTIFAPFEALKKYNVNAQEYFVEAGDYRYWIGQYPELGYRVAVPGTQAGSLKPTEPVNVWDYAYANKGTIGSEYSKVNTIGFKQKLITVTSVEAGDYVILSQVDLAGAEMICLELATTQESGKVSLRAGAVDGTLIASASISATGTVTREIDADNGLSTTELAYQEVRAAVTAKDLGVSDVYIVFDRGDIRLGDLTIEYK